MYMWLRLWVVIAGAALALSHPTMQENGAVLLVQEHRHGGTLTSKSGQFCSVGRVCQKRDHQRGSPTTLADVIASIKVSVAPVIVGFRILEFAVS